MISCWVAFVCLALKFHHCNQRCERGEDGKQTVVRHARRKSQDPVLRYIRIHPKQDVLPTAWRYLGRRRGEPAAAIVIRRGARAGGRGHPRPFAAGRYSIAAAAASRATTGKRAPLSDREASVSARLLGNIDFTDHRKTSKRKENEQVRRNVPAL
jgi:hypothetical protein